jgi:hypothetical protein
MIGASRAPSLPRRYVTLRLRALPPRVRSQQRETAALAHVSWPLRSTDSQGSRRRSARRRRRVLANVTHPLAPDEVAVDLVDTGQANHVVSGVRAFRAKEGACA